MGRVRYITNSQRRTLRNIPMLSKYIYVYLCIYIYTYVYKYMYIYICVCVFVSIYVYKYTHDMLYSQDIPMIFPLYHHRCRRSEELPIPSHR